MLFTWGLIVLIIGLFFSPFLIGIPLALIGVLMLLASLYQNVYMFFRKRIKERFEKSDR